jgi:hypothetical protein
MLTNPARYTIIYQKLKAGVKLKAEEYGANTQNLNRSHLFKYICIYHFYTMIKLFVGGFPLEMTELELVKLFNLHGDVSTIKIVRDKKTKICKGYAFIEMKDQESADNVIKALDSTLLDDRLLTVKIRNDIPPVTRDMGSKYNTRPKPAYFKAGQPAQK